MADGHPDANADAPADDEGSRAGAGTVTSGGGSDRAATGRWLVGLTALAIGITVLGIVVVVLLSGGA
jgi:hypothetical protein